MDGALEPAAKRLRRDADDDVVWTADGGAGYDGPKSAPGRESPRTRSTMKGDDDDDDDDDEDDDVVLLPSAPPPKPRAAKPAPAQARLRATPCCAPRAFALRILAATRTRSARARCVGALRARRAARGRAGSERSGFCLRRR